MFLKVRRERRDDNFMEVIILIVLVVLVILFLLWRSRTVLGLLVNGLIGVILLFLTNLFLEEDIPIDSSPY